jgi:ecdysteroid 25-hydroxylase CYP306A1
MKSLLDGKCKTHQLYQAIIDEHRARPLKTDSFLAAFDNAMTTNADNPGHFTQPQFYHLLADLFGAGTDTTLTTFRWFMLFMAVYPDEQVRCAFVCPLAGEQRSSRRGLDEQRESPSLSFP